jgi:predicted secreted hydrolase
MTRLIPITCLLFFLVPWCLGGEKEKPAFLQAIDPRALKFPEDHASHAGYQTEWWYVTGNVKTVSGRAFGYQFTIFRRAMHAQDAAQRGRTSKWALNDVYIGHLAISDIDGKRFDFHEIVQRGAAGLAGATDAAEVISNGTPLDPPLNKGGRVRVWLRDWEFVRTKDGWTMKAREEGSEIDFTLTETVAPVAHGPPGEEGLSRKGPKPGQASYYYSVPGLKTSGTLKIRGEKFAIASGRSWMDHEFGSNQLSADQAGWDWFSIHLDDGSAMMLYVLRNKDGSVEKTSSGTWIDPAGKATYVALDEIKFTRGRTWTSPHSKGQYTLEWKIEVPKLGVALEVSPAQDDQEIKTARIAGVAYYEGSIRIRARLNGKAVSGDGYLEITGAPGQTNSGRGLGGVL